MQLSTKGRYGLKAMYFLAKNPNENLSITTLATLTETSPAYLEKLMGILKKARLVISTRGASGGYMIAKDAKDISIGDILRALEGKLYLADCNAGKCPNINCPNKNIFNALYLKINKVLDDFSLEDMIRGNYE